MMNIVILAAGQGKRMRSTLPKVLHPIGGKPMLRHVIELARQLRPTQLTIVLGHGKEQVSAAIAEPDIVWVEQKEQQGTGHALKMALPRLSSAEKTLVLYGDVPLLQAATLKRLLDIEPAKVAVLTSCVDDPTGYGRIVRGQNGNIEAIVEDKDCDATQRAIQEVNTGIMVFPTQRLAAWLNALKNDNVQREYYLTDLISSAVGAGVEVVGVALADPIEAAGVNDKEQLAILEREWQRRQAYQLLTAGVTLADPARIDIRGVVTCGQDVTIDVNCVFEGKVDLAAGVTVGPHCILKDVSVAERTTILPFSVLEGCKVENDCRIGPYARIRPATQVLPGAHIGNFVEVKNSDIGAGSKVNHLTYIGDTHIGEHVNIGAGCVTVNYNGVEKFRTTIEDDVFVGSGTMMIAPITLQQGATIGAGSVITQTAPARELTIARARQEVVPGWKRPKKTT